MSSNSKEDGIIHLVMDENNLVKTGFMEKYNELLLTSVFNGYLDTNNNMLTLQREKGDICIPFSLSGLPDVDVTNATNGDVLTYDGSNWIALEGGGEIFTYVRDTPSSRFPDIQSVDGVVDALDSILYPYESPSFSSFTLAGVSNTLELGQYISTDTGGNQLFNWNFTHVDNISDSDGYSITDISSLYTLDTNILPKTTTSKTINIPYGITKTVNGASHTFQIKGKNTKNVFFTKNKSIVWRPRIYWGTSSQSTILSDLQIKDLVNSNTGGSKLTSSIVQEFNMDGNGEYIWICMSQSFGKAIEADGSNSRFVVGGLSNSAWELFSTNFTNDYSHVEPLYLYRTNTVQFGSGINIKIV